MDPAICSLKKSPGSGLLYSFKKFSYLVKYLLAIYRIKNIKIEISNNTAAVSGETPENNLTQSSTDR